MVGVDVSAPIRNVVFSSSVIRHSHRGLSVSTGTSAEGLIENVLFTDMIVETQLYSPGWWGSGEVIFVRAAPWHDEPGRIGNIRFRNVLGHGEGGVVIWAEQAGLIRDISLDRVHLELQRTTSWPMRRDLQPAAAGGPHETAVPAVYIERASRVRIKDTEIRWCDDRVDDYTYAVMAREAPDLNLRDISGEAAHPQLPAVLTWTPETTEQQR